ncbi:fasciclin domain-containing protein [Kineosporia succinea]|uniref:Surface protein with fasciclin (FAS1) repeats n=1 Tax=Kineosporia succinea TaxID=84632 RepID=A0ABT9P7Z6_9ACTN|nr:fasciclin domain-containing protein [Kineosporia succinea]MDP9828539.1 putative surface protein with fasciclin (FAS1) repeats [Kineosporia succinea]
MNTQIRRMLVVGAALTVTTGLAACSGSDDKTEAAPTTATTKPANVSVEMASLVGPGCNAYAAQVPTGKGSVEGMANDPVVTAASHNPMLKTFTQAATGKLNKKVDLEDTLNGGEYTIFAPVDTAFAQLSSADRSDLQKDAGKLTKLLTYHVVAGELAPGKVSGKQVTVEGSELEITAKGNEIKVDGANVSCGGIKTANATVYLIDKVLQPADDKK